MLALVVVLAAVVFWLLKGANRGFTRNSERITTLDEVTGIEGFTYKKHFVPGVDFLGEALIAAGLLAGVSFLFRSKSKKSINQ
jgi:hypothetical protein